LRGPSYARSDGGKGFKMTGSGARHLHLTILAGAFAVCRLAPEAATIPTWAFAGHWFSLTRTDANLSVVCPAQLVPDEVRAERDWCMLRLTGPLPFDMTAVLAAVLAPLAAASIPIFALSTFDTDYVLVKTPDLASATDALRTAGHRIDEA